jgi:hypothetical protein
MYICPASSLRRFTIEVMAASGLSRAADEMCRDLPRVRRVFSLLLIINYSLLFIIVSVIRHRQQRKNKETSQESERARERITSEFQNKKPFFKKSNYIWGLGITTHVITAANTPTESPRGFTTITVIIVFTIVIACISTWVIFLFLFCASSIQSLTVFIFIFIIL